MIDIIESFIHTFFFLPNLFEKRGKEIGAFKVST